MANFPDLDTASFEELSSGLASGSFTSVELTLAYIARIQDINSKLRAVLEINAYAVLDAAKLDQERKEGKLRGPLHGLPILVKDSLAMERPDQTYLNCTAGSYALLGSALPEESTVIKKLRQGGGIVLGTTNLSEWMMCRSKHGVNGWSGRGGQTIGAYNEHQNPEGSSSGSAVAASIGLAVACLGTETNGSLISPASYNHIVSIKPTAGLTSRAGAIPLSFDQDTVGPMAQDVITCAAVLQAIAGKDERDALSSKIPFDEVPDYVSACKRGALRNARIGVVTNFLASTANYASGREMEAFNEALGVLEQFGATIVKDANFPALDQYLAKHLSTLNNIEFVEAIQVYLAKLKVNPHGIKNLSDLIEFNKTCSGEEVETYDQDKLISAVNINLTTASPEYKKLSAAREFLGTQGTIIGALDEHKLDAIVMPGRLSSVGPSALAGLPVVTVPSAFYPSDAPGEKLDPRNGLLHRGPHAGIGLFFCGRAYSEQKLIALAYGYEQATQVRSQVHPIYKPTTQVADIRIDSQEEKDVDGWKRI